MQRLRDRAACGSLNSERSARVICACRGPGGPPLIIASAQEGDDEEEAERGRVVVVVACVQHLCVFLAPLYLRCEAVPLYADSRRTRTLSMRRRPARCSSFINTPFHGL